ncbi:MAG: hypothetical protein ACFCUS_12495 [Rubrimonas sp.]|uniref:hypothetical protein n=1 Tax=Rubrimonas sp. TaxID=2036015 RepID=UPI002FDCFB70
MFRKAMIPVDLGRIEELHKAFEVGASIAKSAGGALCFAGVTGAASGAVAHDPKKYAHKLAALAAAQGAAHGADVARRAPSSVTLVR